MKMTGRLRPSKLISGVAAIIGIGFFFFALFVLVPESGAVGWVMMLAALLITVYHLFNVIMPEGVAEQEFDVGQSGYESSKASSVDERLETLQRLRSKGLINENEYQQKRRHILSKI